jgi:hypothetical protein
VASDAGSSSRRPRLCAMARRRQGVRVRWRGASGEVAQRVGWLGVTPWLHLYYGEARWKARQRWEGASVVVDRRETTRARARAGGFIVPG